MSHESDLDLRLMRLEERVLALEGSVKGTIERVNGLLADIRAMLSELDNPLNFLKDLGLSDLILSITEGKLKEMLETRFEELKEEIVRRLPSKGGAAEKPSTEGAANKTERAVDAQEKPSSTTLPAPRPISRVKLKEVVGLLACTGCLLYMFGRKGLERVLEDYASKGWLPEEVKQAVFKAMSTISSDDIPEVKQASVEDHVVAMYMLDRLMADDSQLDLLIILLLLNKYAGLSFTKILGREMDGLK